MKFQKTIAMALANKLHKKLVTAWEQAIEEFTFPEQAALESAVDDFIKARDQQLEAAKRIQSFTKLSYVHNAACTKECILNSARRTIALSTFKPIPLVETLTDDFLIESLGAESAEELLAKVEAKYSIK